MKVRFDEAPHSIRRAADKEVDRVDLRRIVDVNAAQRLRIAFTRIAVDKGPLKIALRVHDPHTLRRGQYILRAEIKGIEGRKKLSETGHKIEEKQNAE